MNRLRYFYTVAQAGSLTRAAEVLRLSQPALSKAMKQLEIELGDTLLIPEGRGLALTPFGIKVASRAGELLKEVDAFRLSLRETTSWERIRIGTYELFSTYFLGRLLKERWGEQALECRELRPGFIERAVADLVIDYGITTLPVSQSGVDHVRVATIPMGLFGLEKWQNISLEDRVFAVPTAPLEANPIPIRSLDGWDDQKYPRKIRYQVGMLEGGLELCRRGLCICYFPKFLVALHNDQVKARFALREIPGPMPSAQTKLPVYIVKKSGSPDTPFLKKLAAELRSLGRFL